MSLAVVPKNEYSEFSTSDEMVLCLIDDWNEHNPKSKLDVGLIELFRFYIRITYVAGWDDHRLLVDDIIENSNSSISKYFLKSRLDYLRNRV